MSRVVYPFKSRFSAGLFLGIPLFVSHKICVDKVLNEINHILLEIPPDNAKVGYISSAFVDPTRPTFDMVATAIPFPSPIHLFELNHVSHNGLPLNLNLRPRMGQIPKSRRNYGTTTILSDETLSASPTGIPIIDVSRIFSPSLSARKAVAAEIREACINIGFFYVQNHGISQELVDGVFEWGKRFFDLGFEEKMEVYIDNTVNYRGYTPLCGAGLRGLMREGVSLL
jgi:hypothetical protein